MGSNACLNCLGVQILKVLQLCWPHPAPSWLGRFPFSPRAATGVFFSQRVVGGSWAVGSAALCDREWAVPGVSVAVWMCLSQSPAAPSCARRAPGAPGWASNCSKWNWAVAFGDLSNSHREGSNTARALHTLLLRCSRTVFSCFDKRLLNISFFFPGIRSDIYNCHGTRILNKSVFYFFLLNKQSYISKWKSISSKKVEKFSSENVKTEYLTTRTFSLRKWNFLWKCCFIEFACFDQKNQYRDGCWETHDMLLFICPHNDWD